MKFTGSRIFVETEQRCRLTRYQREREEMKRESKRLKGKVSKGGWVVKGVDIVLGLQYQ